MVVMMTKKLISLTLCKTVNEISYFQHYSVIQKMLTCLCLFYEKAPILCVVLVPIVYVVIK